jgi:hypothetical protein
VECLFNGCPEEQSAVQKIAFDFERGHRSRFNVVKQAPLGVALCCSPNCPCATRNYGQITSPVLISLIDLVSAVNVIKDSKQQLHFGQRQI